ncbi:hypothetical protein [Hymenobacter yonginensis]|uniref:Uncharacterized protein n=1 Tax=Hymenobacter yonginensis TaxID=748197 RepID=A0ABY7PSU1_9BACT|nr:hypothetical protein [Hymenobacter yonginensis]WBO85981.1 hypothetical protein O9Z63_06940 [Hymenobacter yonginensis]
MPLSLRNNNYIAAALYFVAVAVYAVPAIYMLVPQPLGPAKHPNLGYGFIAGIVLMCLAEVVLFITVGFSIRAGKTWTKVLYGLFLTYILYYFGRSASALLHQSFWVASRNWFGLALMLSVAFFMFRDTLTRRSAAGVTEGEHNGVN